jgi:hypothetical protein
MMDDKQRQLFAEGLVYLLAAVTQGDKPQMTDIACRIETQVRVFPPSIKEAKPTTFADLAPGTKFKFVIYPGNYIKTSDCLSLRIDPEGKGEYQPHMPSEAINKLVVKPIPPQEGGQSPMSSAADAAGYCQM